ncbi:MAG: amidohydrolase [Chloroflexi bacterium]|nr:amidohydrolase [Chloroflexota bacterium]MCH8196177.1 amidohydrolase [Chloroflexota bacterium]
MAVEVATQFKMISADSHVVEPPDLWLTRLPEKYRDRAPHIESREDGDYQVTPGVDSRPVAGELGGMAINKGKGEVIEKKTWRWTEQRQGAMDPRARLVDQDLDGIKAEVVYPNWFTLGLIPDPDLRAACTRAYNEWLVDFCSVAPDRLIGAAQLPLAECDEANIAAAIAEARRAKDLGLGTLMLPHRVERPYDHPCFEPLWAELQDIGLPISVHISTGTMVSHFSREGGPSSTAILVMKLKTGLSHATFELIWGAVPAHFPGLRFVMTEGGIGWIAFVLRFMDHWWEDHRHYVEPKLEEPPSYYFHRSFWATFEDDRPGILTLPLLNEAHMMWASDYPHTEGTFPVSVARVEQDLGDLSEETRRKLVHDNAAALYGIS